MLRLVAVVALLFLALPAVAQTRHALVVGIDRYAHLDDLRKAGNDARAVHAALAAAGFRAELLLDADRLTLLDGVTRLAAQVQPGDEAVLFYAGHGVEIDGQNFLLPADVPAAAPGQELLITGSALPVGVVLDMLQRRGARLSLLILDACRDNPFPRQGTRSAGATRGLARVDPPEGVFVLYSAGAGESALDRLSDTDPDPNSVFTRALLPRLGQPGLPLHQIAREVRGEVRDLALSVGHRQLPAVYDQTLGEPVLIPAGLTVAQPPEAPVTSPPATGSPAAAADPCTAARADWPLVVGTDNRAALERFIQTHSACPDLAALARERLAGLADAATPAPAAETAHLSAAEMTRRGRAYRDGLGVARNDTEAVRWLRAAAEAGDRDGMAWLASMYRDGHGVAQDYGATLHWFRAAAELGSSEGMAGLGGLYHHGIAVPQNYDEAFRWYRAAAEAGNIQAQINLGHFYREGRGTEQNHTEAVRWFRIAADAGDLSGMNALAGMYSHGRGVARDDAEAMRLYMAAAAQGSGYSMNQIGWMYGTGHGVAQDNHEAFRWYRAATEAGDIRAHINLGIFYRDGLGVTRDHAEALRLYRIAADAGDPDGMLFLADMYVNGWGAPQDNAEAARWYQAAAAAGNAQAMYNLGVVYGAGRGVAQSDAEAIRWYRAAAEAGDVRAMYQLGQRFEIGVGTVRNDTEALHWYRAAAARGHGISIHGLGRFYDQGRGVQRDPGQAADHFLSAARVNPSWLRNNAADISRETLREIQRRLRDTGHYRGALDGSFGAGSLAALDAYAAAR